MGSIMRRDPFSDDATDTVGLLRPADAAVYLRYANSQGNADYRMPWGESHCCRSTGTSTTETSPDPAKSGPSKRSPLVYRPVGGRSCRIGSVRVES